MESGPLRIDLSVLEKLREIHGEDESDIGEELIDLFLEAAPKYLAAMSRALSEEDTAALEDCAHKLRGSSATIGAMRLSQLAGQLEEASCAGSVNMAGDLVKKAEAELVELRRALNEFLGRAGS